MSKKTEKEIKAAKDKLWRMGNLEWKLKGVQKEMREAVYNSKGKKTVFLCSRRLGKSFTMMLIAVEYCLKQPNTIVKVLFPKKKDAKQVVREQMKAILSDCPVDIKPEWKEQDKIFFFPNGSEIQMAGTDGGSAESVRGGSCHLAILDEAGFQDYHEFEYILQSIIMPTLLTTKGKMILASTPSKEIDHPFMVNYVVPARRDGSLIEYDIYSNPLIKEEDIEEMIQEYPGGKEDPNFLREYMLISDVIDDDIIVPEFDKNLKKDVIQRLERPVYYDAYVSGDPAAIDLTVILFAYTDYLNNRIIICDELVLGGPGEKITTQDIADGIVRKEKLNFTHHLTGETAKPYMRIMDNNNKILIHDLHQDHGLDFIPTAKDNKQAQVNKLRMMLSRGQIVIDPKCENLIYHIEAGRWNKQKTKFEHLKGIRDRNLKANHCDALDALIYLARNADLQKNPYPSDYTGAFGQTFHIPNNDKYKKDTQGADFMRAIIGKGKKNNN